MMAGDWNQYDHFPLMLEFLAKKFNPEITLANSESYKALLRGSYIDKVIISPTLKIEAAWYLEFGQDQINQRPIRVDFSQNSYIWHTQTKLIPDA